MTALRRLVHAAWWPPLVWMGVIFWFSAQRSLPRAPTAVLDILLKKGAHALEYAILAVLLYRALRRTGVVGHVGRWTWVLAALYAVSDEVHQLFVPGRQARVWDVLIDWLGAAMAIWLVRRWRMGKITSRLNGGALRGN